MSKKVSKMVNIIFIMGKYHIHKNKWNNSKPNINCFKNEIKNYIASLKVGLDNMAKFISQYIS